jgi:regulatory protein
MNKTSTPSSPILLKAANYCAYQERCHNEVKNKLADWGVYGLEADQIIIQLIELNYLNEERFAVTFAGGKFRVKQWGRLKIKRELKVRGVSDYCIQMAFKEIDSDEYFETLKTLAHKKLNSLKDAHPLVNKRKVYHYLATKGFEAELIQEAIQHASQK